MSGYFKHKAYVTSGQSDSPIWRHPNDDDPFWLVGIHAASANNNNWNYACKMNLDLYDKINEFNSLFPTMSH